MALFQRKDTDFSENGADGDQSMPMEHYSRPSGKSHTEFGTGDLVKLFHSLPQKNFDAEITAVVRTIASFDIDIHNLIIDINNQESLANKRIKVLELEIQLFKAKIKSRQKEMDLLQIGVEELGKSKTYLKQGLKSIEEENNVFSKRMTRKRAAKINKAPALEQRLPITEKIKLATSEELEHINKQGKIQSLRNKFKKRFGRG